MTMHVLDRRIESLPDVRSAVHVVTAHSKPHIADLKMPKDLAERWT